MSNNITVRHLNGKLHDGKLDNGDKVYCIHFNKQFAYIPWFRYITDLPSSAQTHAQVSTRDKK